MSDYIPREGVGRESNYSLVEVRTAHSRAKTALETVRWRAEKGWHSDPEAAAIIKDLELAVSTLEKWRRTGR